MSYVIGIDISLNSTAVCVKDTIQDTYQYFSFFYPEKHSKEYDNLYDIIKFITHRKHSNYFISLIKLSEKIFNTIRPFINKDTIINIEGLSFNSNGSARSKLIELTSLLKAEIYCLLGIESFENLRLVPPKTLKKFACQFIYKTNKWNNVAGGNFSKHDMMTAFYDNVFWETQNSFYDHVHENFASIVKLKTIKPPYTDLVDAYFLSEYI